MLKKLQARIAKEESGFTLLELLVVIVILGILLAIAVPSYIGFKGRSEASAAKSNVRAAMPAVEAFAGDQVSGYKTMTTGLLKANYDKSLKLTGISGTISTSFYCIYSTVGSKTAHISGPGGTITTTGACA